MKRLYIIGNGFDLHHDLKTSYVAFGYFLEKNYGDIYDHLIEFYGLPSLCPSGDTTLWNEFEQSLALLDIESVFEAHRDSVANPGALSFRDRDWNTFSIDVKMVADNLTVTLFLAFKQFILNVGYPKSIKNRRLSIDKGAMFLSFNYTDTLERFYQVEGHNILYIHSKASSDDDEVLILGHGQDPSNFDYEEQDQEPPEGLGEQALEMWIEDRNDNYNFSYELGKQEIASYFSDTFKNTGDIIFDNTQFFNSLKNVEEVVVLGHSMSNVDFPYLEKVRDQTSKSTRWFASYYDDDEFNRHTETLLNLGIEIKHIKLFRLSDWSEAVNQ